MTPRLRHAGLIAAAALSLALSACEPPEPPVTPARQAEAACRERADAVYAARNPAAIYRADEYRAGGVDTPFSAGGLPGITTNGLAERYSRDTMLRDCLRGTSGGTPPNAARFRSSDIHATMPPRP